MTKIAIIEDDKPVSNQLKEWTARAVPGADIDQLFTHQEADAAIRSTEYDLITLDIELGVERNAGVSLIKEAMRTRPVPVLVVSGMPGELYRGVMKALDAWDYLQKPVEEHDFNQMLVMILNTADRQKSVREELRIDPLSMVKPTWNGQRLNLTATQQRLLHAIYERRAADDPTVRYDELYKYVATGRNTDNLKRQFSQIRAAFKEVDDSNVQRIVAEPMVGYRWISR